MCQYVLSIGDSVRLRSSVKLIREKVFTVKMLDKEFVIVEDKLGKEFLIKENLLVYDAGNTFINYLKSNDTTSN